MAVFAKRMLVLLSAAVVCAASDCSCNCEAVCGQLVEEQRKEIARLQAQIRALHAPARRASDALPCEEEAVELRSDEEVEALQGCRALRNVTIYGDGVTSLAGLQSLETVTDIKILGADATEQDKLVSLAGLENLRSVDAGLTIVRHSNLLNLSGLQGLQTAGHILVGDNKMLQSCTGLENLQSVEADLAIERNSELLSLSCLESLRSAGGVHIDSNGKLASLTGPENLASVRDGLVIRRNYELLSLGGLQGLQTAGYVDVAYNTKLTAFFGLGGLKTVGGDLSIQYNSKLMSLFGLEGLTGVEGGLTIRRNYKLVSLAGLENLQRVGGGLSIGSNSDLRSIQGLVGLQFAGGLDVDSNGDLESLNGLGGLTNVEGELAIHWNDRLESLAGLENLRSLGGGLGISYNFELRTLSGLGSLQSAGTVEVVWNSKLESLLGLGNLTSVEGDLAIEFNNRLDSLAALENLRSVGGSLSISYNRYIPSLSGLESLKTAGSVVITNEDRLASLAGLENLMTVEAGLTIRNNINLLSLSGLQSLRSAGQIEVDSNAKLASLSGLGTLTSVRGDFTIINNVALLSLEGLESLQTVGSLQISERQLRSLFPGLQSLAYAWSGVTIKHCGLSSLHGLGALYRASELRVQREEAIYCHAPPMQFLGGPFAAGASVDLINIDEESWPVCTSPHERMALLWAVGHMEGSSIPMQRCDRELIGLTCTRGRPCSFSHPNFSMAAGEASALESVFISGRTSGCGACPETHLQARASSEGVVDFGYALRDEEAGLRSVCLCNGTDLQGPAGQLLLRGPRPSGVTHCSRGHNCTVRLDGEALGRADRVVLAPSCSDPVSVENGFAASWTSENVYLLHDHAGWNAAPPGRYEVCWRAPCSVAADGPTCSAPEDEYLLAGQVDLFGPDPSNYTRVLGEVLRVANVGFGVLDGDHLRLLRRCGEANKDGHALHAISSGRWFHFDFREPMQAGSHHLCWCQESNGVDCTSERHFMAESGVVSILCPAGRELVSTGRCGECPAGRHQPMAGLEPCSECPAGRFSTGGETQCEACPFAELAGSSTCVPACRGWESANAEATGCFVDPWMLVLLAALFVSVGALCVVLVRTTRRRVPVVDVSLDHQGCTVVTTLGSHGLSNFGRASFPVTLHDTGLPGLDSPEQPLRARVKDDARLELLTSQGGSIGSRLDSSMGTLVVAFPRDLFHQGWPVPTVVSVPMLSILVVILLAVAVAEGVAAEAFVGVAAVALACTAVSAALRRYQLRATPLARRLSEFKQQLPQNANGCKRGPDRAIAIGQLHKLLEFFRDFIRDRSAFYLISNVLVPLTKPTKLSYAELVGPGHIDWFVSHYCGTAYEHFCAALRKHAQTACDEGDWTQLHYWVCFCSNNLHEAEEIGAKWEDWSFYTALKSRLCKGTCMVLDDKALPLTRVWCLFELLQTVKVQSSKGGPQGLLFCTSSGVLSAGSGSAEVAMALAKKACDVDLGTAEATSESDAKAVRDGVIQDMGSSDALKHFICCEVYDVLGRAQSGASHQFAAALAHLDECVTEVPAVLS